MKRNPSTTDRNEEEEEEEEMMICGAMLPCKGVEGGEESPEMTHLLRLSYTGRLSGQLEED